MSAFFFIILLLMCLSSSLSAMYAYPLPKKDSNVHTGYTQIAVQRIPLVTEDAFEGKTCKENCDADSTCKGFSTWETKDKEPKSMCLKHKTKPNEWMSLNQFFTNKDNAKIFSRD